jgi:broad specificity phosphatase PhoE
MTQNSNKLFPTSRLLILIRHAHRDTVDRAEDNGLSEKGRRQSIALARYYTKAFLSEESKDYKGEKPRIYSSPKKRCMETVAAIAREAGVRVEISQDLSEQRPEEDLASFKGRVEKFIEKWRDSKTPNRLTVVCSHGDWLPIALASATGARVELKKGSWAEVRVEGKTKPKLDWLIQSFRSR